MQPLATSLLLLTAFSASSCSLFLPGRSDSKVVEGERVKVTFTSAKDPSATEGPVLGAAAAVAAGVAIDFVQKELETEANTYEAQFTGATSAALNNSLPESLIIQRYVRDGGQEQTAFRFQASFETAKIADTPASMYALRLVPKELDVSLAKAKILSGSAWWWFLPTAWYSKLFRTGGSHVNVQIDIVVEALWWNTKLQRLEKQVMAFSIPRIGFDLDGAPRQLGKDGKHYGSDWQGAFPANSALNIRATITETDPSNAREFLLQGSKSLGAQRERIVEEVTRIVGGGSEGS